MVSIHVRNVSKYFTLDRKVLGSKEYRHNRHAVLKNISFDVSNGECVGIIGKNGSGKSTLLKLLSGILEPDGGSINIDGKVLPLIDLNAGMTEELTGRENILLKGTIFGLSKKEIQEKMSRIIEYSGLGDFIDVKYKKYSDGMKLRLAFSIVMDVPHDIILIDEILAVGDEEFQKKSAAKLDELRLQGKTIVIVSHDLNSLISKCDRVILLDEGKILADGAPEEAVSTYLGVVGKRHAQQIRQKILEKLEELEASKQQSKIQVDEKRGALAVWIRGITQRRSTGTLQEDAIKKLTEELKALTKDYQCLLKARHGYLRSEYRELFGRLKEQRQYADLHPAASDTVDSLQQHISETENEIKQILDEEHFLLKVKIKLGEKGSREREERQELAERIKCTIEEASNEDRKALNKTYLHILREELHEPMPTSTLLPVAGDFTKACFNILQAEDNPKERVVTLGMFLETIEALLKDVSRNEQWVAERLLETTKPFMESSDLHPEEGRFRIRYVNLFSEAISDAGPKQAPQRILGVFGRILKPGLSSIEDELAALSLEQGSDSPPMDEKDLLKRETLTRIQEELVEGLRTLLSKFKKEGVTPEQVPADIFSGLGGVVITDVSFLTDEWGEFKTSNVIQSGNPLWALVRYRINNPSVDALKVSLIIHHETGLRLLRPNLLVTQQGMLLPGEVNEVTILLQSPSLPLYPGRYPLTVAVSDPKTDKHYDYKEYAEGFIVVAVDQLENTHDASPGTQGDVTQPEMEPAVRGRL